MSLSAQAPIPQFPDGDWLGTLDVGTRKIPLRFHITRLADGKFSGTMDSPDQGAFGMGFESVVQNGATVEMKLSSPAASFSGTSDAEGIEISGWWEQSGTKLPLKLRRSSASDAKVGPVRPQMPKPPFPYKAEDVTYASKAAGVQLAGTLTLPQTGGPFPAVLLITGSGAQDRDETILGHKPFWVLADSLTRRGIAVLRVDDRGTAKSTGNFGSATTADFVDDAAGSVAWLRTRHEIDPERIGLIGHSEGATVAPMLAVRDGHIAFLVMLAGVAVQGREVLKAQRNAIAKASGSGEAGIAANEALVEKLSVLASSATTPSDADVQAAVDRGLATMPEAVRKAAEPNLQAQARVMAGTWMRFFYSFDPATVLSKLTVPVLAINGSLDTQVVAAQNLPVLASCLEKAGNPDYEILKMPGLNHLMQTVKTGAPQEYAVTEETVAPVVLDLISTWILRHTAR